MPKGIGYGQAALKDYLATMKRTGKKASPKMKKRIMRPQPRRRTESDFA